MAIIKKRGGKDLRKEANEARERTLMFRVLRQMKQQNELLEEILDEIKKCEGMRYQQE
jgi:hypothetical protein